MTIPAMMPFSGISGSKLADVTAIGTVTVSAMRSSGQDPRDGVALPAASAIMAETIPPCIDLIVLGYVANISVGGPFAAGILPMAAALIAGVVVFSARSRPAQRSHHGLRHLPPVSAAVRQ